MPNATPQEFCLEEWNAIAQSLTKFHTMFYRFWTICRPAFSTKIPTAAVYFSKTDGEVIDFLINPDFWATLSTVQRLYVICHECDHIILNHGKRAKKLFSDGLSKEDRRRLNIAMDIAVNEGLVLRFDFVRSEIDPDDRFIWADKIGRRLGIDLESNRSFEYYYSLLKELPLHPVDSSSGGLSGGDSDGMGETVDDHSGDQVSNPDDASDAVREMAKEMDDSEVDALEKYMEAEQARTNADGMGGGDGVSDHGLGHDLTISNKKVREKKKWETIIRNWAQPLLKDEYLEVDQWAKVSRRFELMSTGLSLPYEYDIEDLVVVKERIDVYFFLDTSGSCVELADRFFSAARSLPKKRFDVHLFCFTTKVYPLEKGAVKAKGSGGTKFDIIESHILKHTTKYPGAVFIITDGWGNRVNPKKPEDWYWFLSMDYREYIPLQSNVYMLEDFE